jgi:dTDP-4-dehydrorhamnose reductase
MKVVGSSRRADKVAGGALPIDLADPDHPLPDQPFDFVVLCAGMTGLNACEADQALCQRVNVDGSYRVLDHFAARGSHVVFPSSNAVFSGEKPFYRPDDTPDPRTRYGKSKHELEIRLLRQHPERTAVLRATRMMHEASQIIDDWTHLVDGAASILAYDNRYMNGA